MAWQKTYSSVLIFVACCFGGAWAYVVNGKKIDTSASGPFFNSIQNNYRMGKYGPLSAIIIKENAETMVLQESASFEPISVESITKSVASLVLGIALKRGAVKSIDQRVMDFFPYYRFAAQSGWESVTIRDLLTMRSGIIWDEDRRPEYLNPLYRMYKCADIYRYIFAQRVSDNKVFNYSSANTALLSQVIFKASGMSFAAYADSFLFKPLGIKKYTWSNYINGRTNASGGLGLLPADLLKIGELCLQKGKWGASQIVGEQWIDESFAGITPVQNYLDADSYGYLWWINSRYKVRDSQERVKVLSACGYNNNHLILVPEKNTIIVTTGYSSLCPEKYLLLLQDVLR